LIIVVFFGVVVLTTVFLTLLVSFNKVIRAWIKDIRKY